MTEIIDKIDSFLSTGWPFTLSFADALFRSARTGTFENLRMSLPPITKETWKQISELYKKAGRVQVGTIVLMLYISVCEEGFATPDINRFFQDWLVQFQEANARDVDVNRLKLLEDYGNTRSALHSTKKRISVDYMILYSLAPVSHLPSLRQQSAKCVYSSELLRKLDALAKCKPKYIEFTEQPTFSAWIQESVPTYKKVVAWGKTTHRVSSNSQERELSGSISK